MTRTSTIPHFAIRLADIRAGPEAMPVTYPSSLQSIFLSTMTHHTTRFFALDPTTKGFGYVVFEMPFRLIEWDIVRIADDKHAGALVQFEKLLTRFRPDAVVLEDAGAPASRRCPRVRRLIRDLAARAKKHDLAVHLVARLAVLKSFSSKDARATKYAIAVRLAEHFPELAPELPPPRKTKPWQTENERMSIFDALALVVTYATT